MSIGAKFNKMFDTKTLAQEVREAKEKSGEYREVPFGQYEVSIEKLELVESKKGDPMVTIWLEVVAGEYKNSKLFYNQVISSKGQIGVLNRFLESLGTGLEIKFDDYVQYEQLLQKIYDRTYRKLEYGLEYAESKPNQEGKTFTTYKITHVFELTQEQPKKAVLQPVDDDEELPFD